MTKPWQSVVFRLAFLSGILVIVSTTAFAVVFYLGTIHSLERRVNRRILTVSQVLLRDYEKGGITDLQKGIQFYLTDGVDYDTEIFLLTDSTGRKISGNLASSAELMSIPFDRATDQVVIRYGVSSDARVLLHKLPTGELLVVGRDMKNVRQIMQRLWRTMSAGCIISLLLALAGTFLFHRELEGRIGAIRQTVEAVKSGRLEKRIPVTGSDDEFARLSTQMNRMFDRIEQLMGGVRHISNTIAHNLRTPLGRIRSRLDEALRDGGDQGRLAKAAEFSIGQIDELIATFDKLLQIAESESGAKRRPFEPIALREVIATVVELYDAIAEARGITLSTEIDGDPKIIGDKHLLASAFANLLDNALKYGASSVTVRVHEVPHTETVALIVQDNGPGIPEAERSRVIKPFYRLDHRTAGTGLGLSIVAAIVRLHNATLQLEDAAPGLRARIDLPLYIS